MKPASPLRMALVGNAIFAFSSALVMLFGAETVGHWLGIQAPLLLQFIGVGLAVFAVELIYQATRQRVVTWRALFASAADFAWVAASIVLLLAFSDLFSSLGTILLLAVAGAVLGFGVWQLWAVGYAHRIKGREEYRHCIIVETNASAEDMWQIIGAIGNIKSYMPSLKSSVVLDGKAPGVGAVRACEDRAGRQWSEECTAFVPGRSFAVRFLSEAPNFPFPAKAMRGGWEIAPSRDGSQVMVWWELTPKSRILAPLILPILAFQVDRDIPEVIARMTIAALGANGEKQRQVNGGGFARLLSSVC